MCESVGVVKRKDASIVILFLVFLVLLCIYSHFELWRLWCPEVEMSAASISRSIPRRVTGFPSEPRRGISVTRSALEPERMDRCA